MSEKKNISAVIFDCDGVMFDSRTANINFYNHILARFGLPPMKEDDIAFVHAHTAEESVRYIFRGTPYIEEALAYRDEVDYTPFIRDMVIEPGLKELLTTLKPCFGLAVATNRSNTIQGVLKSHHLETFFDIVVSSLDVDRPKPHPESLYKILNFFGIPPDSAVYVGDSQVDLETARAAGVSFIAYRNRHLEARWKISDLLELRSVLRALGAAVPL